MKKDLLVAFEVALKQDVELKLRALDQETLLKKYEAITKSYFRADNELISTRETLKKMESQVQRWLPNFPSYCSNMDFGIKLDQITPNIELHPGQYLNAV